MFDNSCIFCKIIQKKIQPASIIKENEFILVIPDINPKAPIHYLIIPKKHIIDLTCLTDTDNQYALEMVKAMTELGNNLTGPKAFNIVSNNGSDAGQSVLHLHWHFLAGKNIYNSGFSL
ncbi:MAG: HIT domain-containing protein [bacterium]